MKENREKEDEINIRKSPSSSLPNEVNCPWRRKYIFQYYLLHKEKCMVKVFLGESFAIDDEEGTILGRLTP